MKILGKLRNKLSFLLLKKTIFTVMGFQFWYHNSHVLAQGSLSEIKKNPKIPTQQLHRQLLGVSYYTIQVLCRLQINAGTLYLQYPYFSVIA